MQRHRSNQRARRDGRAGFNNRVVKLRCRSCPASAERELNLPDNVEPPHEFTCSACNAGKSAHGGRIPTKIETDLARKLRAASHTLRPTIWDRSHKQRARIRAMLRPKRYGKSPCAGMTRAERAEWYARTIAEWQTKIAACTACPYCGLPVTPETAYCRRIQPLSRGGANEPVNWTPACESCAKSKSPRPAPRS